MAALQQLTRRQEEVVAHLRSGETNKEIAAQLAISEESVKAHLSRLYLRFGVSNRVALLAAVDGVPAAREVVRAGDLGQLRSIVGRLRSSNEELNVTIVPESSIEAVRRALTSIDAALDLVTELPDETKGAVLETVRRRVESGFAALDELQRTLGAQPRSAATR